MSVARLKTRPSASGVVFSVEHDAVRVLPNEWARYDIRCAAAPEMRADVGVLLRWIEEARAIVIEGEVSVDCAEIAALSSTELLGVGLPEPCRLTLIVQGSGLVTSAGYRLLHSWRAADGKPVIGVARQGAMLQVGKARFTLCNPLYEWVEALERFNASDKVAPLERLQELGRVLGIPVEQVLLEGVLKKLTIVLAEAFTVRPTLDSNGRVFFHLVPLKRGSAIMGPERDSAVNQQDGTRPALPDALQSQLEASMGKFDKVLPVYAVGASTFLVWPQEMLPVLEAVRKIQRGAPRERMEFIRSPFAVLNACLGESVPRGLVDDLFDDALEFSARVREIGLWHPKVLPFIKKSGEEWLPPEEGGLQLGDQRVRFGRKEAEDLLNRIQRAIAEGVATVAFGSATIPATQDAREALEKLCRAFDRELIIEQLPLDKAREWRVRVVEAMRSGVPSALYDGLELTADEMVLARLDVRIKAGTIGRDDGAHKPSERIGVVIEDNLEKLGFQAGPRVQSDVSREIPECVRTGLLAHQKAGLAWLQERWVSGARGAVLADDMGLGKTLTLLAFLAWLQRAGYRSTARAILVVAPTGLLRNWRAEIERHLLPAGLGEITEAHGAGLAGMRLEGLGKGAEAQGLAALDPLQLTETDVVLTTYETVRDYQISFCRVKWLAVVIDEAQKIKNPAALMTDAVKALNTDFCIAATGTPVENSLQDLWSIADAVEPGVLGALKEFAKRYASEVLDAKALSELREKVMEGPAAPLMLRRMKHDHLEGLPAIEVVEVRENMPPLQAEAYALAVESAKQGDGGKGQMLQALQRLRSVSLHPLDALSLEGDSFFFEGAARTRVLAQVLDEVRRIGERALVFVESLAMQGYLMIQLQRRYGLDRPPLMLNGQVPGQERQRRVDAFQRGKGFGVMLLTPRAGGVGLTLHAANHVIHLDRWWNPAVEDQCTDRVYRIGQKRPVRIYVPLAVHPRYGEKSFDLTLNQLLAHKRSLSRTLLAPVRETDGDLRQLFVGTVGE